MGAWKCPQREVFGSYLSRGAGGGQEGLEGAKKRVGALGTHVGLVSWMDTQAGREVEI